MEFPFESLKRHLSSNNARDGQRLKTITETISVPTSEHVSQIVGKAGFKIKSLRAKTNTWIKTPLRGEQPIFTITGNPEGVRTARLAIQYASQQLLDLMSFRAEHCGPGEVTIRVVVPAQYVGVVVGRGGIVIKKIKEQTNTRIDTPLRNAYNSAFEITGTQVNVLAAKEAIIEKVCQALQLRSSSIYDPNLNRNLVLNPLIQMPIENNYSLLTQFGNSYEHIQSYPSYDIPIGLQSNALQFNNTQNVAYIPNNAYNYRSDNEIGNILYENYFR